jgi:hypothetical protein
VGTVSAPALLGGLVDLDVLDDQVGGIETLGVGVGLSVLEQTEKDLGGLDGPAGLGDTESLACGSQPLAPAKIPSTLRITILQCCSQILLFLCFFAVQKGSCVLHACVFARVRISRKLTLGGASSAAGVAPHGDGLLVLQDVTEVSQGTVELPSVDGLGGLAGVLERDTEVGAASAGALCVVEVGCSVTNLRTAINFAFENNSSAAAGRAAATARGDIPFWRAMRSCVSSR